jgi:hypothetical protein
MHLPFTSPFLLYRKYPILVRYQMICTQGKTFPDPSEEGSDLWPRVIADEGWFDVETAILVVTTRMTAKQVTEELEKKRYLAPC